jgi:hypothetical protein
VKPVPISLYPPQSGPGTNPGLCGERQVTINPRHSMARNKINTNEVKIKVITKTLSYMTPLGKQLLCQSGDVTNEISSDLNLHYV